MPNWRFRKWCLARPATTSCGDDQSESEQSDFKELFTKAPATMKEVVSLLAKVYSKVLTMDKVVRKELTTLKQSVEFMSNGFDDFRTTYENNQKVLQELKDEQNRLKSENKILQSELKNARLEPTELQQYSRRMDLELKGAPEWADESLTRIILDIGTKVGVSMTETDIDVVHRVPSKDKQLNVIRFASCRLRDSMLASAKKKRILTSDLGLRGKTPIYVNKHLCRDNKLLLANAIAAKKRHEWKFAWVSRGRILMRKYESPDVMRIFCETDLEQIA